MLLAALLAARRFDPTNLQVFSTATSFDHAQAGLGCFDSQYIYSPTPGSGTSTDLEIFKVSSNAVQRVYSNAALFSEDPQGAAVDGNYLFISSVDSGGTIRAYDVSDRTSVGLDGATTGIGFYPTAMVAAGSYLYALINDASDSRLAVFDKSSPGSLSLVGATANGSVSPSSTGAGLVKSGDYLFAVTNDDVYSFDVSSPSSPSVLDTLALGAGEGQSLVVVGDYLFVLGSDTSDAITTVDISTPSAMSQVGSKAVGSLSSITMLAYDSTRDYLFVGSEGGAAVIYDASTPASLTEVGRTSSATGRGSFVVSGQYVVVGASSAVMLR